ncbi:AzlD domain-containing protein [Pseudomonas sp. 5P_3.1_Bac2]|uniref:AzlD domain-containing protein n=1 Tax=Pseudomonas sp. 5P_3.1_Bac2 TaxID=2971617 RepID=UPI0021C5A1E6|nr:AzlD domain-containing protein [Pseudomonas sp. 5P_3.1_Bac2]MCU1717139.1 AzlD domain-containing protein [Pseudomonas sp. 5P_3.1_Bac2]
MTNWQIIVVAGATSYLIRSLPIVLFNKLPMAPDGLVYRYLNYAALSVMGGIIYTALYGQALNELTLFSPHNLLRLATVILAVVLTAWKRKVFLTLVCCLAFYYFSRLLIER